MWRYARDWGISIAIAILIYLAIGWLRPKPSFEGEAPDFTLPNIDGGSATLSEYRGKTVVLNFWATWCGPCRTEIPSFSEFATENPDVVVLGVATDGSAASLKKFRDEVGITYPIVVADRATNDAYQVESLPTTVVVGPDGAVKDVHVGIMMKWQLEMAVN